MAEDALLEIRDLKTWFFTEDGVVRAVDGVSFSIPRGKTLGVVGESGCGKSVTALSILRLVAPPGRIVGGQILFRDDGETLDLVAAPEAKLREIRGAKISMIFQEPMTSLNPVFTIGYQIMEAIQLHQRLGKSQARARAIEMLDLVRIPEPQLRVDAYPHQLSGGMRQRAMIAMALSCHPRLLIADEPTTALDVTIQAQFLELLRDLQRELKMSVLYITHDLGVVSELADEVVVMYASKVVEHAGARDLFRQPLHPYTHGLFRSRPRPGMPKTEKLSIIPGAVPNPLALPPGCRFHPRCPFVQDRCRSEEPALRTVEPERQASCHFAGDLNYE